MLGLRFSTGLANRPIVSPVCNWKSPVTAENNFFVDFLMQVHSIQQLLTSLITKTACEITSITESSTTQILLKKIETNWGAINAKVL